MKCHKGLQTLMDSLDKRPKLRQMHIRFGTWNVRSLYRASFLMTVVKELSIYVRFSESTGGHMGQRWHQGKYAFFYVKGNENHELGTVFFLYVRESYQQLRGSNLLVI
jgi:hypothetical protein